ncbi:MAG: AAA family ATPase, partial [Algicola sp.]|nr:AAA family ATPase [Algicola sp.]
NVSLVTARPLLLSGTPGCGKSSVAFNLARVLKRRYYEQVISSRTRADDLLWQFDHIRRLADANVGDRLPEPPLDKFNYVEPGVLWWAFEPSSAKTRGYTGEKMKQTDHAKDPKRKNEQEKDAKQPAVILIDEIDKAEPDVPNNLLEVIGSQQFRVSETGTDVSLNKDQLVSAQDYPLIVITTNQERELPPAFVRRCIVYRFDAPDAEVLKEIAINTIKSDIDVEALCDELFKLYQDGKKLPQVAEFIDTVTAAAALLQAPDWNMKNLKKIIKLTIDKQEQLGH